QPRPVGRGAGGGNRGVGETAEVEPRTAKTLVAGGAMPLVPFHTLMQDAEKGGYAVGYFESWNLESLLAVAAAAQATRSPLILGFSGIYLLHPQRWVKDPFSVYAAMGLEVGRGLSVPCCLLFNESPHLHCVLSAVDLGYQLVMYTDDSLAPEELEER